MAYEITYLAFIVFFLAFLGFMSTLTPPQYQIITPFDLTFLAGGVVGVTAVCTTSVLGTSACGVAVVLYGLAEFLYYFISASNLIKTLILTPLSLILVYIVMRLARGGG